MSELPDMISAVVGDKKIEAETHFKNTMAQKIGNGLDLKRVEVANSLIKGQSNTSVENSADEEV
ncbi:MAG: hypothetical protein QGH83_13020 [Candidatus Pacebacteria bacterium]|jgi:hypothetical protein|nr:hypothetical protein [Candidatus Paceibacterota bacterium]|tara:strand:+ start:85 stop:276 length:192 start_codon:yes stop_codon:yes gene_type:complete